VIFSLLSRPSHSYFVNLHPRGLNVITITRTNLGQIVTKVHAIAKLVFQSTAIQFCDQHKECIRSSQCEENQGVSKANYIYGFCMFVNAQKNQLKNSQF
jgi:hypothetical protein